MKLIGKNKFEKLCKNRKGIKDNEL